MKFLDFLKKQPKKTDIDAKIDLSFHYFKEMDAMACDYQDYKRVEMDLPSKDIRRALEEFSRRRRQLNIAMTKANNEFFHSDFFAHAYKAFVVASAFREECETNDALIFFSDDANVKAVIKTLLMESVNQPIAKYQVHDSLELAIKKFALMGNKNTAAVSVDDETSEEGMGIH